MKQPISLSIFFPAYNEEANIEASVQAAEQVVKDITPTYEIIIINDGSKDKTGAIADKLAKSNKHIRVVHHSPNQGYGAAVWSGIQAARYDYVFFTDADLQFDLTELKKLIKYVPEYKAVIGYRAKRRDPFMRLANAKGWNILNRILFGLRVKDIDCAFKLLDRKMLIDLPVKSRGAMLSAELLIRLQRMGIRFKEVPVTHLPRTQGSPTGARPDVIVRAFKELFQTYRGDLGSVTHRQLVKFAIVGGTNTILDIILYYIFTRYTPYFHDHILIAKTLSFTLASLSSFTLNRNWTFRKTNSVTLGEVVKFYLTVGAALIINVTSVFALLRFVGRYDLLAVIGATVITFVWNFTISKFWVFSNREGKQPTISVPSLDWLLLISMLVATVVGSYFWLKTDLYPPHWDMAVHLRNSLLYTDSFHAIIASDSPYSLAKTVYTFFVGRELYYPPFAYWVSVPFIYTFGRTFMAAVLSNSIFAAIGIFTLYALGKKIWNRTTGLLAALVFVTLPFIAGQFHEFQLDMPLTVMTALSFWALLQTNRWRNYGWSFIFGAICGLAMLTKWSAPAFVIGPAVYELVGRIRAIHINSSNKQQEYKSLFLGLVLSGLGLLLIAGPWYGTHLHSLRQNLGVNWETGTGEGDPSPLSKASLRLYSDVLIQAQIRFLMLVPFAIGLIRSLIRREERLKNGVVLGLLFGGYIVMTLYNNKDYRFIEPVMGGVALLAVYWTTLVKQPWQRLAIAYIIAVSIFQFLTVGWGNKFFPNITPRAYAYLPDIQEGKFRLTLWEFTGYGSGAPRSQAWPQEELLTMITETSASDPKKPIKIAMYYKDNMEFNRENMTYYILKHRYPIEIVPGGSATFNCQDLDYIIATDTEGHVQSILRDFPYHRDYPANTVRYDTPACQLQEIYAKPLPNGTQAYIWKINK